MLDDWIECTLADACDAIDYGLTASASGSEVGPRFLRITDIVGSSIDWKSVPFVSADQGTSEKFRLHDGDIVLARTGASTGASSYVKNPPRAIFASYLVRLKAKPEFDPRFLAYYLKSDYFLSFIRGVVGDKSAQPNASASTMTKALLRAPRSLAEQSAIAEILGALDDKIELNRRMNETLEGMARAIFKSWFVDFDPVRAKAEGRQPSGMDSATAALFPDSFQDFEAGEIPTGWCIPPVYELATYINGAAYRSFEPNDQGRGLPIIKIAELKSGVTAQTRFSTVRMPDRYKLNDGDILFSWSGNPDTSIDIFVWNHGPAWLNQHIFRVIPHSAHERAFVLVTLRSLRPVFAEVARNKQTTGLGHVTVEDLKRLLAVKPPKPVLMAWNTLIEPILARSYSLEGESRTLAAIRDALLPKLISGEIRVADADKRVEALR